MDEDVFPEDLAIRVRGVGKTYRLGVINRRTMREELVYRWLRLRGRDPRDSMGRVGGRELAKPGVFDALDDVSFDIRKGETVGLIGRNGAGKSTMLKILARIMTPTRGEAWIRGRVGSLLEVGTGFHPELTGRENIYLNGTILGMKKAEIDAKFDEIVEFSEIADFLDTPVKRYSSGMYVKLAFSIAASLDTDVLLLDEVLAVGDAAFQKKCLARMKKIASSGRTIIFVSHSMPNIKAICSRCLLFDRGELVCDGVRSRVCAVYDELSALPFLSARDILKPQTDDGVVPVCRFRSQIDDRHFLTASRPEIKQILGSMPELKCDGVVFRAFRAKRRETVPLFRFCSNSGKDHLFVVGSRSSSGVPDMGTAWRFEKIACYVYPVPFPDSVPVRRFSTDGGFSCYAVGDEEWSRMAPRASGKGPLSAPFYVLPAESVPGATRGRTTLPASTRIEPATAPRP